MSKLVTPLSPPYYAVIFSAQRTEGDKGYAKMAQSMVELASKQKGFLGVESVSDSELEMTVSYWETLDDIKQWKEHSSHLVAQQKGKEVWYKSYSLRVCKVERDGYL